MLFKKKKTEILSPCYGEAIKLSDVKDEVFSSGVLGDGFAVIPSENSFFSPVSGEIINAYETAHAYSILSDDGIEVLVHIGIDTVELDGKYFTPRVNMGSRVREGELLCTAEIDKIKESGYDTTTMVIVANMEKIKDFKLSLGEALPRKCVMECRLNKK